MERARQPSGLHPLSRCGRNSPAPPETAAQGSLDYLGPGVLTEGQLAALHRSMIMVPPVQPGAQPRAEGHSVRAASRASGALEHTRARCSDLGQQQLSGHAVLRCTASYQASPSKVYTSARTQLGLLIPSCRRSPRGVLQGHHWCSARSSKAEGDPRAWSCGLPPVAGRMSNSASPSACTDGAAKRMQPLAWKRSRHVHQ